MKKNKEWLKEELTKQIDILHTTISSGNYVKLAKRAEIMGLIDQLDEPELPVIPQFVAEVLKEYKGNKHKTLYGLFFDVEREMITGEFGDWFVTNGNYEVFCRAWLDGYTVEKETLYNVKIGKGYFGGFNELKVTLILNDQPGCMDDVIIYSDKKDALKIAEEIGGVVEEVPNE